MASRHDNSAASVSEDETISSTLKRISQSISSTARVNQLPNLRKHPAKFKCSFPKCERRFTRHANLQSHIRVHCHDRPFKCTRCFKAFTRPEDCSRHVKERHEGTSKQHICGILGKPGPEGCGQKFTRAEALRRHLRLKGGRCKRPTSDVGSHGGQSSSGDEQSDTRQEPHSPVPKADGDPALTRLLSVTLEEHIYSIGRMLNF